MRMMYTSRSGNARRYGNGSLISRTTAMMACIVGLAMVQPFIWIVMVFGTHTPYMTLIQFMSIVGLIVGGPVFLFGLMHLICKSSYGPSASTTDLDISRIRYTVETDKIHKH